MANTISQRTAQEIVKTVKDVCGYDINFIRPDGIIDASTDPGRIGTFHEIGYNPRNFRDAVVLYMGLLVADVKSGD